MQKNAQRLGKAIKMVIIAVIPCYNEARSASDIIARASQYVDRVIVPDDNSTDNTVLVAKKAEATITMNHTNKRGAGANTKRGIDTALALNPDIIVTLDGDGQHNPDEIPRVVKPIIGNKANLIIGSRFMPGHYDNTAPRYRRVGIGIITSLYNIFSSQKVYDAQSCFRAFDTKALEVATITERGFPFSIETLIKARHAGLKIVEVPVSCIYHKELRLNSSMNPIKQGISLALTTIKWRVRLELVDAIRQVAFNIIKVAVRPLIGKGLGRLRLPRYIYSLATQRLTPEQAKTIEVEGFLIKVSTKERGLDGVTTTLAITHSYESMTTQIFKNVLGKGMNVIDIGANIGYFSLLSSKLVSNSGKVWAIEPEPNNFRNLVENIRLNSMENIIPVNRAASDTDGKARLFVSKEESGEHSLVRGRPHIKNTIEVNTFKLDDLIDNNKIDFIKTDTEGHEMSVLSGASNIITCNKNLVLITEFWPPGIKASGHTPRIFWQMLERYDFKYIYIIDEIKKEILPGTCEEAVKRCWENKLSVNLLCSREQIDLNKRRKKGND